MKHIQILLPVFLLVCISCYTQTLPSLPGKPKVTQSQKPIPDKQKVKTPAQPKVKIIERNKDTDGDGIIDAADECPDQKGPMSNKGCPSDVDGDGIIDEKDACPGQKGLMSNNGCPSDVDGDGVMDDIDTCPNQKGPASNKGCPNDTDGDGIIDDKDGCPNQKGLEANNGCPEVVSKYFASVTIGSQVWMQENLNVDRFRNGDIIPEAKSKEEWERYGKEGKPAWCYYNNDPSNGSRYGKLYNWYAVNDPRGLAPKGWHIPGELEWLRLTDSLGSSAGSKMKSASGSNSSGFAGLPGGYRYNDGTFNGIGDGGYWWSSTEYNSNVAWSCDLDYENGVVYRNGSNKAFGFSVRFLRD